MLVCFLFVTNKPTGTAASTITAAMTGRYWPIVAKTGVDVAVDMADGIETGCIVTGVVPLGAGALGYIAFASFIANGMIKPISRIAKTSIEDVLVLILIVVFHPRIFYINTQ